METVQCLRKYALKETVINWKFGYMIQEIIGDIYESSVQTCLIEK